jgi:DNA-binding HxlR family transcriptional regulator
MKEDTSCTCGGEKSDVCFCPLEGIIDVVSKKWTLQIIAVVGNYGKRRYSEILGELRGISPKSLSDRLKELENYGLIKREAFAEIPPRVEYSLTSDGREFRGSIRPLMKWMSSRSLHSDEKR